MLPGVSVGMVAELEAGVWFFRLCSSGTFLDQIVFTAEVWADGRIIFKTEGCVNWGVNEQRWRGGRRPGFSPGIVEALKVKGPRGVSFFKV